MKKRMRLLFVFWAFIFCLAGCAGNEKKNEVFLMDEGGNQKSNDSGEYQAEDGHIIISHGTKLMIPKEYEVRIDDETGDIYINDQNLNWEMVMIVREGVYEEAMKNPKELMAKVNPDEATIDKKIKEINVKGKKYAYFTFTYKDSESDNTVIYTGATDHTRIAINMRIIGEMSEEEAIGDIHNFLGRIESTEEADTLQEDLDKADKEPLGVAKNNSILKCNNIEVQFKVPEGFYSVYDYADETMSTEGFMSDDEKIDINVNLDISRIWESENDYLNNELKTFKEGDDYYKELKLSDIKTVVINEKRVFYILEKYTVESGDVKDVYQKVLAITSIGDGNYLTVNASTLSDIELTMDSIKVFFYLGE